MYSQRRLVFLIIMAVSFVTVYCGDPVPVKEMGAAKAGIGKAEFVKADQYAPGKYKEAKDALFASHDLVSKEEYADAKEKAIEAGQLAKQAYDIAVPKLADAEQVLAKRAIAEAEQRNAEKFAEPEFSNARVLLATGEDFKTQQKYLKAFQDFEKSKIAAEKARNIAESQAAVMKRDITEIEDTLQEAERYGAKQSAATQYNSAKTKAAEAKTNVDSLQLKAAYGQIQSAKASSREALSIAQADWANKKNAEAKQKVTAADSSFSQLKQQLADAETKKTFDSSVEAQDAYKATEDSLAAAKDSLRASNSALSNKAYQDSYNQSEEAIRLAKIVNEQIPQVTVLVSEARKRAMGKGKKEPENVVVDNTETKGSIAAPGWKKYKVRLIPNNRDCLWKIARYKKHYGNARLWPRIYKANKYQIKNPDLIYPGQVFDVPPRKGSLSKPKADNSSGNKANKDGGNANGSEDTEATDDSQNAN